MKANKDTVVKISYQLRTEENGNVVDEAGAHNPFSFLFGHDNVLPKFEGALKDLQSGDAFTFVLNPEDGYGVHNPEAIVELSVDMFKDESGNLQKEIIAVGNMIPLQDNQGNRYQGLITKHEGEIVIVDLNHPMAGKTLYFSGSVMEVRTASTEELEHGHVHDGSHHH